MEILKVILEFIKATIWPITILIIILVFHDQINVLFQRIKKAELPGGINIETFPIQLQEAKETSKEVKKDRLAKKEEIDKPIIKLTEANKRMITLGLAPSPSGLDLSYYRNLAKEKPIVAFAGLRMEIDLMIKNLAKGFKVEFSDSDSTDDKLRLLRDNSAISDNQLELIKQLIKLCNEAINGFKLTEEDVNEILDIATVLRDDYIAWLSWGFNDPF